MVISIKNVGKSFELNFSKSVPDYVLLYRLPDSAQSFGGSSRLRFSKKNPFDYLLWDSIQKILYALELKTVAGKSISFERSKEDAGEIHYHQICGLKNWAKYDGIITGFIIEFREIEKTVFIEINDFDLLVNTITKKSFNYNDIINLNIPHFVISQEKLRTNYKYDIESFLNKRIVLSNNNAT